jgi:hypothetical protein
MGGIIIGNWVRGWACVAARTPRRPLLLHLLPARVFGSGSGITVGG